MLFQEHRKAIPIMSPFPSYGKLKKYYGSQARFQYELQMEMRNRAKEIYSRGGISISDDSLGDVAKKSFLPKKLVKLVMDFWIQENCLTRLDDGLYNIGGRESAARKMIEEAGKYEIEGT